MSIYCAACRNGIKCVDAVQLVPCLHVICLKCQQKTRKTSKVCPAKHCYSPLVPPMDIRWNPCEYERCLRKLAIAGDVYHTACQHDLCAQCFDEANKTNNAQCPVGGCAAPLNEDDELEPCEGPCRASYEIDKMVALPCCQVYMCQPCAKKWTEGKGTCPPGKCLQKGGSKARKGRRTPIKTPCSGLPDCEGEVLRNFPSEMECEHEVCINCLAKVLEECEHNNSPPVCPNEACRLPYRCETVLALRALFPERAAYFSRFDLESHYSMEALKDDTITLRNQVLIVRKPEWHRIGHCSDFRDRTNISKVLWDRIMRSSAMYRKVCFCEDEENQTPVEFEKTGPLGDLVREIRRVLKIMNTDKRPFWVYGYFKREGDDEKQLDLTPKLLQTPVDKIGISKDSLILVDITGIVNNKSTKKALVSLPAGLPKKKRRL
ncbi:hypothetical protein ANCDUO_10773 [Ancylostoma duodenale]|uniref:RING-type domain-containing protein n=1 Tax=Ancylostoma duodenale TaxID=51022 RepID=A0A0C2GJG9_9BILA|nr:hypothetical protein ANCDUO_10773 [Ancylostoma duodenale]